MKEIIYLSGNKTFSPSSSLSMTHDSGRESVQDFQDDLWLVLVLGRKQGFITQFVALQLFLERRDSLRQPWHWIWKLLYVFFVVVVVYIFAVWYFSFKIASLELGHVSMLKLKNSLLQIYVVFSLFVFLHIIETYCISVFFICKSLLKIFSCLPSVRLLLSHQCASNKTWQHRVPDSQCSAQLHWH